MRSSPTRSSQTISQSNATFMSRVYFWMMLGLVISGVVAYSIASSPELMASIYSNKFIWIGLIVMQLAAVVALSALINKINALTTTLLYIAYAALSGATFSVLLMVFTTQSITQVFFITAFAFTGLSAFAYFTKRDLGPIGSFCMIGLFGLIGFILVTMLFPSLLTNAVSMTINTLGILIFAGLTAYDTQRIKNLNPVHQSSEIAQKAAISGALMLYLDFINLFINLLQLIGDRR
jgi:FtsH-binding integral membrane protein